MGQIEIGTTGVTRAWLCLSLILAPLTAADAGVAGTSFNDVMPPLPSAIVKRYGPDRHDLLDLIPARGSRESAPLLVILPDDSEKARYGADFKDGIGMAASLRDQGVTIVRVFHAKRTIIGARGVADNVLRAITYLRDQPSLKKVDFSRIVIAGFGSGAADAALIGCDPSIAEASGLSFGSIRAILLIGGYMPDPMRTKLDQKRSDVAWFERGIWQGTERGGKQLSSRLYCRA